MQIELLFIEDYWIKEHMQKTVFACGLYGVSIISTFTNTIPKIRELTQTCKISALIDYPYGHSTQQINTHAIIEASRSGASCVDIVLSPSLIYNKEWRRLREYLKIYQKCAEDKGMELRPILEYRLFPDEISFKVADCIRDLGVTQLIIGTGTIIDDVDENLIICGLIHKKYGIPVVGGVIWNADQLAKVKNCQIYATRVQSRLILEKWCMKG